MCVTFLSHWIGTCPSKTGGKHLCTLVSILGFSSSKHRVAEARMRHRSIRSFVGNRQERVGCKHVRTPLLSCSNHSHVDMFGRDHPSFGQSLRIDGFPGLGMDPARSGLRRVKRSNADGDLLLQHKAKVLIVCDVSCIAGH